IAGGPTGASPPTCFGPTSTPSARNSAAERDFPAKSGLKITPMQLATACDGWTSRLSVTMLCERIAHPGCWSHVARLGNRMGPAGGARPDLSKTTGTHDPGGFARAERLAGAGPKCRFPTALLL